MSYWCRLALSAAKANSAKIGCAEASVTCVRRVLSVLNQVWVQLAICASKLQHFGRCMTATEQHTQLGKRFIELSEQCHKQINTDAVGWWKDEVRV